MEASLNSRQGHVVRDAAASAGPARYWPLCLAVALVAMFAFYVTLQGLVRESAARAPAQASVTPASVQPPLSSESEDRAVREVATRPVAVAALPAAAFVPLQRTRVDSPRMATPVRLDVTKCITPSGEAEYSDGPCSEGARVTTLHLQE
ncbi:hypothetical protein VLK31_12810 [Variovorax sp. H27-G14]|uniref:hypothetical protein n=1 Tax=Variovorax sp. H27-G14 TaxID=3111914 RepID=UPI0038FC4790